MILEGDTVIDIKVGDDYLRQDTGTGEIFRDEKRVIGDILEDIDPAQVDTAPIED